MADLTVTVSCVRGSRRQCDQDAAERTTEAIARIETVDTETCSIGEKLNKEAKQSTEEIKGAGRIPPTPNPQTSTFLLWSKIKVEPRKRICRGGGRSQISTSRARRKSLNGKSIRIEPLYISPALHLGCEVYRNRSLAVQRLRYTMHQSPMKHAESPPIPYPLSSISDIVNMSASIIPTQKPAPKQNQETTAHYKRLRPCSLTPIHSAPPY